MCLCMIGKEQPQYSAEYRDIGADTPGSFLRLDVLLNFHRDLLYLFALEKFHIF